MNNAAMAVLEAEKDWVAHTGEHARFVGSGLDRIFVESGWSRYGVPRERHAVISDWCGMAVGTWYRRAGLNPGFLSSFFHTFNVAAFFTYGRIHNVNRGRLDVWIETPRGLEEIEAYHAGAGLKRRWVGRTEIEEAMGRKDRDDLFTPGDTVLLDWSRRNGPDHITLVRKWDGRYLDTIEGNATGPGPDGKIRRDAVVVRRLDLSTASARGLIYGAGRLSPLDFGNDSVREWRRGDPPLRRSA